MMSLRQKEQQPEQQEEKPKQCECMTWATEDPGMLLLTGHNERCPKREAHETITRDLIKQLVRAMEQWRDQSGFMCPNALQAYRKAKMLLME